MRVLAAHQERQRVIRDRALRQSQWNEDNLILCDRYGGEHPFFEDHLLSGPWALACPGGVAGQRPRPSDQGWPRPSGAPEDRWALLGEGPQALEIVAAVVGLPAQPLDALVHVCRNGLVVRQDAELFLDDRHGHG